MKIEYVTGNTGKFNEAQLLLSPWELEQVPLDLPEIQGEPADIIIAKARAAMVQLERPLVVEDVSLHVDALNGLPGPYVKDVLFKIGDTGFYELVHKYSDHRAQIICLAAYAQPGIAPIIFQGVLVGQIVAPRGISQYGERSLTRVFKPEGLDKTMGEMSLEELSRISARSQALKKLRRYLETQRNP